MHKFTFLLMPLLALAACSSGGYKMEVSCAEDPQAYNQEREELYRQLKEEEKTKKILELEEACKRPESD